MDYFCWIYRRFPIDGYVGLADNCCIQQYLRVSISIKLMNFRGGCFTKNDNSDFEAFRWNLLIPIYLLAGLMLARTMHVFQLILFVLFCFPCYCISDTCLCKKKFAIKGSGTSKVVLEWLETQKWTLKNVKDFEDFALIVKLRAEN